MDLLSLVLTLTPLRQPESTQPLPTWWARAAHALLLNVTRQFDPKLAESLHEESELRPFTVSTLMGAFPQGRFDLGRSYTLRLTSLTADLTSILFQAAQDGPLAAGATLELDFFPFRVEAADWGDKTANPWPGLTSYADLSSPYLLAKIPAPRKISLLFTSPTTFKSGGKHVPVPLPEWVFGSLLERWNRFAPIAFPPEARRYAEECLALSRYRLSSRPAPSKGRGVRVGGVGSITYTTLNYDRYWMSVIGTLAAFALYAGVGAGTSQGLGQCRVIEDQDFTGGG